MKIWNWKNLETYFKLLSCLCVPHLLQEQKHNENICENLKQEIRVSNTPFSRNQAWNHNFKHNSIFSSLKKHLFMHTYYKAEWTQLKSTQLVLGTSNVF